VRICPNHFEQPGIVVGEGFYFNVPEHLVMLRGLPLKKLSKLTPGSTLQRAISARIRKRHA